jgi:hypothetical protein
VLLVTVPSLRVQFGDLALSLVSLVGAVVLIAAMVGLQRLTGEAPRSVFVTDALTILILSPALAVASSIAVADSRLGGRSWNFLAAGLLVCCVAGIILTIVTRAGERRGSVALIEFLPAVLTVTSVIAGVSRFSAGNTWQGLSLAWGIAAGLTLALAATPRSLQVPLAVLAWFGLTLGMIVFTGQPATESIRAMMFVVVGLGGVSLAWAGIGTGSRIEDSPETRIARPR